MFTAANAWYTYSGNDNDTVISSRVRIMRNLRHYRFPPVMDRDEAEEVYAAIVPAFQTVPPAGSFHPIRLDSLDAIAKKIFEEIK